jgi:ankyrin repeat protein
MLTAQAKTLSVILETGIDASTLRDARGWTPLHSACASGSTEKAALLFEAGCRPDARADDGENPVSLAARSGINCDLIAQMIVASETGEAPALCFSTRERAREVACSVFDITVAAARQAARDEQVRQAHVAVADAERCASVVAVASCQLSIVSYARYA